ncbi:uncharacterized protein LOC144384620 isoform X3 [Gasterosteus aculeatus]
MGLPLAERRDYANIKRAVVDKLGLSPEDHRRRFREARLGPQDRPFAYVRLKDANTRWLQPDGAGEVRGVTAQVVLQQGDRESPPATVRPEAAPVAAMVDSGCTWSMIHQSLVRPGALVEADRDAARGAGPD